VIPSAVFARYARSLADVVFETGAEPAVSAGLSLYRQIFSQVPDLLQAFDSPAIPREVKEKLLAELIKKYPVHPIGRNFLRILLQHNRIRHFGEIADSYGRAVNERKGIISACVTAASALQEKEVNQLRARLAAATGKSISLEVRTDPHLVGGAVLQIGSTVYDGSIRRQLEEMKRRLAER
jgi:F-type H+-transporting ATPase subunit delta